MKQWILAVAAILALELENDNAFAGEILFERVAIRSEEIIGGKKLADIAVERTYFDDAGDLMFVTQSAGTSPRNLFRAAGTSKFLPVDPDLRNMSSLASNGMIVTSRMDSRSEWPPEFWFGSFGQLTRSVDKDTVDSKYGEHLAGPAGFLGAYSNGFVFWGATRNGKALRRGHWRFQAGELSPLRIIGEHAPGYPESVGFGDRVEKIHIASNGDVAFISEVTGPGFSNAGAWGAWLARGHDLQPIARLGGTSPTGKTITGLNSIRVRRDGSVLLFATVRPDPKKDSINVLLYGNPEALEEVEVGNQFCAVGDGPFIATIRDRALWTGTCNAVNRQVVRVYDPAPAIVNIFPDSTPRFTNFFAAGSANRPDGMQINAQGDIAFWAQHDVVKDGRQMNTSGLWFAAHGENPQLVLARGQKFDVAPQDTRRIRMGDGGFNFWLNERGDLLLWLEFEEIFGKADATDGYFIAHTRKADR